MFWHNLNKDVFLVFPEHSFIQFQNTRTLYIKPVRHV